MTRDELLEKMGDAYERALSDFAAGGYQHISKRERHIFGISAALSVVTEWLEREAKQANERINNPHRNQDFTTNIRLAANEREIRRLIAVTKGEQ